MSTLWVDICPERSAQCAPTNERGTVMQFHVNGDGERFEVHLLITWQSLHALLKAILPMIAATIGLLAAPELARLLSLLGWR